MKILLPLVVVACSIVICCLWPRDYIAQYAFAVSVGEVKTNANGDVIQPKVEGLEGLHNDARHKISEQMSEYLRGQLFGDPLKKNGRGVCERFLLKEIQWMPSAMIVSNMVRDVRFEVVGCPIPVVMVSVHSPSRELAVQFSRFVADDFCRCLNEYGEYKTGKVLAWLTNEKARRERLGENVAQIQEKIELATTCERMRRRRVCALRLVCSRHLWPW